MKDDFAPSAGDNTVKVNESIGFNEKPLIESLQLIDKVKDVFEFTLGQKVRNRHNEDGYIELCGIDYRGVIYLVHMHEGRKLWYTSFELKPINYGNGKQSDPNLKSDQKIKTDIPDPKKG